MPAFFAYLVALGLLLGGGYGALNWLGAPEPPAKVAKAKHHRIDAAKIVSPHGNDGAVADTKSSYNEMPAKELATTDPAPKASEGLEARRSPTAIEKLPQIEAAVSHRAEAVASRKMDNVSDRGAKVAAQVSGQKHGKQARGRGDRRPLEMMTLRTIEFPDGRRMTQLLPYRPRQQALAFQSE